MYVEVVDAINQLTRNTLPPRFVTAATKMCEYSNTAIAYFIVELTDRTIFDWTSPSHRGLREEFARSITNFGEAKEEGAKLPPSGSKPKQMDPLEKAKQRLNGVFQRHGYISEPELRELLADLYKQLVSTLQIGDRIRDWKKEEDRTLFADQLIEVLRIADKVRRNLYPLGKIQTWDDYLKRVR